MVESYIEPKCSFCDKESDPDNGNPLIQGLNKYVFICANCVTKSKEALSSLPVKLPLSSLQKKDFKPSTVLKHLDNYIIGQNHAKMILAVAVYNHYKYLEYKQQKNHSVELEKSNIIMLGPTGCGKTALARHLAKILKVPFAMADATNLTQAGYVGEDPENIVRQLVQNANWNIELAQRGIIYIDEIDKLSRKSENLSITRDVSGEGVQQALLKIIEGSIVEITEKGQRKHPSAETLKIDTSDILFIVGGSFEGIEKLIESRKHLSKANLGFGTEPVPKNSKNFNDLIFDVKTEDLKKFGMLPEFLGRLPIICALQELTESDLLRILSEPKNALVKQYQELMKLDSIELDFTKEALTAIVKAAIERKSGARALRSIMENTLLKHMYNLPELENIKKVTITEQCVTNGKEPVYEYLENRNIA